MFNLDEKINNRKEEVKSAYNLGYGTGYEVGREDERERIIKIIEEKIIIIEEIDWRLTRKEILEYLIKTLKE